VLKRLYVDNVRCLQGFELKPEAVSLLVGPNGGGKSTVFEVLQWLQQFLGPAGKSAAECFPVVSLTRWDRRPIQTIEIECEVPANGTYVYRLEVHHDLQTRVATVDERLSANGQELYRSENGNVLLSRADGAPPNSFPVDARRSLIPVLDARAADQRIGGFKQWLTGTWLFKLRPDQFEWNTTAESDFIDHGGRNYVSWYRTLVQETPQIAEKLKVELQSVIPGLTGIRLTKVGADSRYLVFDCNLGGKQIVLGLNELSDGQRVLLALYTILHAMSEQAYLLAFDEPDNFVATQEIQPWLAAIRERLVASGRGTLLVLSHHPEVIDYLAPDQIIRLWRDETGPSRQETVVVDLEQGLTASTALNLSTALKLASG
jgi:energy-coupling factor transporter ATP-binding protein EcfA2